MRRKVGAGVDSEAEGDHPPSAGMRPGRKRRLGFALCLTSLFLGVEVAGGILSNSLALLADAGHMFTDVAALILAYAATSFAERPPTKRYSFGFYRAEILAAFVNALLLLGVATYILYEAYQRFSAPPEIRTGIMLGVGAAGLAANLASLRILHGDSSDSLNVKAAYLEVITDTLGSVGVLVAALVMPMTGWYWLDPALSAVIGLSIVPRATGILKQSARILLEGTPESVDTTVIRRRILEIAGVQEIHDLHFWTLTSGVHCASVHVLKDPSIPSFQVIQAVQDILRRHASVNHSTVQVDEDVTCESEHA